MNPRSLDNELSVLSFSSQCHALHSYALYVDIRRSADLTSLALTQLSDLRHLFGPPLRHLKVLPGLRSADPDQVTSGRHPDSSDQSHGLHLLHRGHGPRKVLRSLPPIPAQKVSSFKEKDLQ